MWNNWPIHQNKQKTMSLESVQAEWDELSKEFSALEVKWNRIVQSIFFKWANQFNNYFVGIKMKWLNFYFQWLCCHRKQVMNMPSYWRNSNDYNKNVSRTFRIRDIALVKLAAISKSEFACFFLLLIGNFTKFRWFFSLIKITFISFREIASDMWATMWQHQTKKIKWLTLRKT